MKKLKIEEFLGSWEIRRGNGGGFRGYEIGDTAGGEAVVADMDGVDGVDFVDVGCLDGNSLV